VRFSAKAEYACLAIIALAEKYHEARPLPIREIAKAQGIPATFLTQILLKLKGAGLVLSTRGSSGGYRLARAPEAISLLDILRVINDYGVTSEERIAPSAPVLAQVWEQIRASEIKLLSDTSIAMLLKWSHAHDWVI
jgi:Rrf2 family protein